MKLYVNYANHDGQKAEPQYRPASPGEILAAARPHADHEAAIERAIDRAIDVLPWEHEIDNFVRGEYDDWLRAIVLAALGADE